MVDVPRFGLRSIQALVGFALILQVGLAFGAPADAGSMQLLGVQAAAEAPAQQAAAPRGAVEVPQGNPLTAGRFIQGLESVPTDLAEAYVEGGLRQLNAHNDHSYPKALAGLEKYIAKSMGKNGTSAAVKMSNTKQNELRLQKMLRGVAKGGEPGHAPRTLVNAQALAFENVTRMTAQDWTQVKADLDRILSNENPAAEAKRLGFKAAPSIHAENGNPRGVVWTRPIGSSAMTLGVRLDIDGHPTGGSGPNAWNRAGPHANIELVPTEIVGPDGGYPAKNANILVADRHATVSFSSEDTHTPLARQQVIEIAKTNWVDPTKPPPAAPNFTPETRSGAPSGSGRSLAIAADSSLLVPAKPAPSTVAAAQPSTVAPAAASPVAQPAAAPTVAQPAAASTGAQPAAPPAAEQPAAPPAVRPGLGAQVGANAAGGVLAVGSTIVSRVVTEEAGPLAGTVTGLTTAAGGTWLMFGARALPPAAAGMVVTMAGKAAGHAITGSATGGDAGALLAGGLVGAKFGGPVGAAAGVLITAAVEFTNIEADRIAAVRQNEAIDFRNRVRWAGESYAQILGRLASDEEIATQASLGDKTANDTRFRIATSRECQSWINDLFRLHVGRMPTWDERYAWTLTLSRAGGSMRELEAALAASPEAVVRRGNARP